MVRPSRRRSRRESVLVATLLRTRMAFRAGRVTLVLSTIGEPPEGDETMARTLRWREPPLHRGRQDTRQTRPFLPSSTQGYDDDVGDRSFSCDCSLLAASRAAAHAPWAPHLHLPRTAPSCLGILPLDWGRRTKSDHHPNLTKVKSATRDAITNTNAQNQAQPDRPSWALNSIIRPHASDINAIKARTSSRSESDM